MSCNTCNQPVLGNRSLPGNHSAYIGSTTESPDANGLCDYIPSTGDPVPVSAFSVAATKQTAYYSGLPGGGCSTAVTAHSSPFTSARRWAQKYVPGWIQKLTSSARGKLLVANGQSLHSFAPENKGHVYYDGCNISTDPAPLLTHAGGDGAIIEDGFLPLAFADSQYRTDAHGETVKEEVYRHGIQQVRQSGVGELLGLQIDCSKGTVRQDVIEPEAHNLVTKGWIDGFTRLGYRTTQITNGCKVSNVKEWFSVTGAAFGPGEVIEDTTSSSFEAALIPVSQGKSGNSHVLVWRSIDEKKKITEEEADSYRLMIAKPTGEGESGHGKYFLPIPEALINGEFEALKQRVAELEIEVAELG